MSEEYTLIQEIVEEHKERMMNIRKYYPFFKLSSTQFTNYKDGAYDMLDMGYIVMAVLRFFIEQNNFNDQDVTYSEYEEFTARCLKRDFNIEYKNIEDEKELIAYIFDKIRNDGRPFSYEYYDPYEKEKKISRIRLIESHVTENSLFYSITSDGIEFYLDTKEIKDESTISVQQLLLQKMIKAQNFKGGTEVIKRINNEVRKLMLRKNEVLNILGNDIYEGLEAYEDFVETGIKWFDDEQRLFAQNTELIEMALKRAEGGVYEQGSFMAQTVEDIHNLENELKRATNRHASLLSACTDLQIKVDDMVRRAKVNRLKNTMDFKSILNKIIRQDRPELLYEMVRPLMGIKTKKTFDTKKIDDILTYRYEKEEQGELIQEQTESEIKFDDEIEDERIENNYALIMSALLYCISKKERISLVEFNEYLKKSFGEKIFKNGDYYSFIIHLCQKKEYNLAELNREPDTFLEGIINNNMRRKVYDEYMNLHFIIEFADGEEKTVKINDMFEISNIEFVRKDD